MLEIGAFQAKNTLGALLDRVENGEEVLITRHGRPVARLVPNKSLRTIAVSPETRERAGTALQRLDELSSEQKLGAFNWEEFKADRDAGRK